MKEIDEFIAVYNEYLANKKVNFNDVNLIAAINGLHHRSDPIEYFLTAFRFPPVYNYSGFCFIQNQSHLPEGFIHFATPLDYNLSYVYCQADGEIYLWSEEDNRLEWRCAKNPSIFFSAMSAVIKTKIKMQELNSYELDQGYLKQVFDYCLSLNDNDEDYILFYDHILGIESGITG